jgi:uncharacterized protein (DUF849 family)
MSGPGSQISRMKVCLNGQRGRGDHPGLPITPAELAASAEAAVAAGAEAVHVHPRDADGQQSLAAADVGAAVAAIRAACPGTPVGVTTGLWITGGDPKPRRTAVAGWADLAGAARPDFATVNVCEEGWTQLIASLHSAGIGVEAGVWTVADARALATFRLGEPLLRIMIEIMGGPAETAAQRADDVMAALDTAGLHEPRLLHGEQESCWPLVAHAGALGLPSRIGLEDTVTGPYGEAVTGNAELVRLGLSAWRSAVRR